MNTDLNRLYKQSVLQRFYETLYAKHELKIIPTPSQLSAYKLMKDEMRKTRSKRN